MITAAQSQDFKTSTPSLVGISFETVTGYSVVRYTLANRDTSGPVSLHHDDGTLILDNMTYGGIMGYHDIIYFPNVTGIRVYAVASGKEASDIFTFDYNSPIDPFS